MRVTMIVRNTAGLKAKIEARTRAKKQRVLQESQELGAIEQATVALLANRDTHWMAEHTDLRFTRGGFNYAVGYWIEDFVGQMNTNADPPRLITRFYPVDVIYGTRFYAGNDFLTAAHRLMRAQIRERYAAALRN